MAHYEEQSSGWGGPALLLGLAAVIAIGVLVIAGSAERPTDPTRLTEPAAPTVNEQKTAPAIEEQSGPAVNEQTQKEFQQPLAPTPVPDTATPSVQ